MQDQSKDETTQPDYGASDSLCEDCPCECATKANGWIVTGCGKRAKHECA